MRSAFGNVCLVLTQGPSCSLDKRSRNCFLWLSQELICPFYGWETEAREVIMTIPKGQRQTRLDNACVPCAMEMVWHWS